MSSSSSSSSSSLMKQVWNYLVVANYAVTWTIFLAIMENPTWDMICFPYWALICFCVSMVFGGGHHATKDKACLCIFIVSFSLGCGLLGWFALTNADMKLGRSSLTFADLKFNVLCAVIARCLFDVLVCALNP